MVSIVQIIFIAIDAFKILVHSLFIDPLNSTMRVYDRRYSSRSFLTKFYGKRVSFRSFLINRCKNRDELKNITINFKREFSAALFCESRPTARIILSSDEEEEEQRARTYPLVQIEGSENIVDKHREFKEQCVFYTDRFR